ncbi:hypothetical protein LZT09_22900 [Vibrio fluvialis]|jgi:hypothetical protein|nr:MULTISPECIES: hypothetical protein [Vibrio]HBC3408374.1 hypothetical protein [Vibrio parahaemolyticus]AVH31323.1 hypothetical protein AL475_05130 [Vibrio fluvialis]EKO3382271.1 hypothetical protein [Vibrio fluvialis]EKO3395660.1 hypothetical protein [Vibrio fluvialis]EKO3407534.1 hypothetical protein [Vibrio fluvialis]
MIVNFYEVAPDGTLSIRNRITSVDNTTPLLPKLDETVFFKAPSAGCYRVANIVHIVEQPSDEPTFARLSEVDVHLVKIEDISPDYAI